MDFAVEMDYNVALIQEIFWLIVMTNARELKVSKVWICKVRYFNDYNLYLIREQG